MKISKLNDIKVYKKSIILVKEIYQLTKILPLCKDFSLVDQIRRAVISVAANIAEGYGRHTRKDFASFLSIALGSTNEVIALLDIIHAIYPKINTSSLKEKYNILGKRIYSFRKSLTTHSSQPTTHNSQPIYRL